MNHDEPWLISACERIERVAETPGKRGRQRGGRVAAGHKCERAFLQHVVVDLLPRSICRVLLHSVLREGQLQVFVCHVLAIASSVGLILLALGAARANDRGFRVTCASYCYFDRFCWR